MHEQFNGLEAGADDQSAEGVVAPDSPRVSEANDEIVLCLRSQLGGRPLPVSSNLARLAAHSAVALARRPVRKARVTAANWPPLLVPTQDAQWKPPLPAPATFSRGPASEPEFETLGSAAQTDFAAGLDEVSAEQTPAVDSASPEPVATDPIAPVPVAPARAALDPASPVPASPDPASPDPASQVSIRHDFHAYGGAGQAAVGEPQSTFSFRPGDRALPRFSVGQPAFQSVAEPASVGEAIENRGKASSKWVRKPIGTYVRTAARWAAIAFVGWFAFMLGLIVLFRFVDPPGSTLILWQWLTGTKIEQRWVPLSRISSNLKRAVVVSEDGRFCHHWGIDPREVLAAIQRARGGVPRGASTITMQVAKNLFLWPSKSYLRKVLEVPITFSLELLWSKSRILEVYLNIAEWGPGVFGAEAASQYHFGKSASQLTSREGALLAVALPNPIERRAGKPGRGTARLASLIQSRVRVSGNAAACVLQSR